MNRSIKGEMVILAGVLLAAGMLYLVPYIVNWTENTWHWVNDEGPSFLVYIGSYYLSRALLWVLAVGYLIRLFVIVFHDRNRNRTQFHGSA